MVRNKDVEILYGKNVLKQFRNYLFNENPISLFDGRKVGFLVKPNMLRNESSSTGITTDVKVVEIIVDYLYSMGFRDIIVGDGGEASYDTMETLRNNNYFSIVDIYPEVKIVDLNKGPMIPKVIGNVQMFINKYALDHYVISVAKLKPHGMMQATMTLKNLMGCVLPKGHMHDNFTMKIRDVYNYIKPIYGVVDGIIANGRCENIACPVKMNTILCGRDLPTVDKIGSMIIGRTASHIDNLYKRKNEALDNNLCDKKILSNLINLYRKGGLK